MAFDFTRAKSVNFVQLVKKTCNIIAHSAIGCPGGKIDRFLPLHHIQSFILLRDVSLAPAVMDLSGGISPICEHAGTRGEQSPLQLHDSPELGDSTQVLFLSRHRDFAILHASSSSENTETMDESASAETVSAARGHGSLVLTCLKSRRVLARLACSAHQSTVAAAQVLQSAAAPDARPVGAAEIIAPHAASISPIAALELASSHHSASATLIANPSVYIDAAHLNDDLDISSTLLVRRVACDALARLSSIAFDEARCELVSGHADGRVRFWSH